MIILLPTLVIAGLIAYYFIIFKPKQHEKKVKRTSRPPLGNDPYNGDEIIEDYPTYHRNK